MKKLKELLLIPFIIFLVWGAIKIYRMPGQSKGAVAPDFVGYMADGDSLRLSDFKGQLVLLDLLIAAIDFLGFRYWCNWFYCFRCCDC